MYSILNFFKLCVLYQELKKIKLNIF